MLCLQQICSQKIILKFFNGDTGDKAKEAVSGEESMAIIA